MKRHTHSFGRRWLRGISHSFTLAVITGVATIAPFAASQVATAATETKLGPTNIEIAYAQGFGNSGDLPMPDCGSFNIEGRRGHAEWNISSSLGDNSVVFPGTEWEIKASMYVDNLDASPWVYNDGPDPLILQLVPTGPIERVTVTPVLPAGLGVHDPYTGSDPVGPKDTVQIWGYAFDSNSKPKLDGFFQETSDGVDLTLTYKVRATAPGKITLPKLQISGWDSTPIAADIGCSVPLDWEWTVIPTDKPSVKGEAVKVDSAYTPNSPDERNDGSHTVIIDVLKNDDDLNTAGGVGDTDEIRISNHSLETTAGGSVSCGLGLIQSPPEPEYWDQLPVGPCLYSPPFDYSGPDSFEYTVRQNSDQKESKGVVSINVVGNSRPGTVQATVYVAPNLDTQLSIAGFQGDPNGDPVTCLPTLVSMPDPAIGTVSMNSNCTFEWDYIGPGNGAVDFSYRVCDTHQLVTQHGTNTVRAGDYTNGIQGDLSETTSRRCRDGDVRLFVEDALIIPPIGVTDYDKVDSGYSGDGVGPYTIAIPVLENDFDPNGPAPMELGGILDGPDPSEGTVEIFGESIFFTPADGYSGGVQFSYRVCEPPLPDEMFGFCGIGQVVVLVVGNQRPLGVDDPVAIFPNATITDLDVKNNDVEGDVENLTCDTTPVAVSDPALVSSISITPNCLVDIDPADDASGMLTVTYRVCDDHELTTPTHPAPLYGADDREPGDIAPRCDTANVVVTFLNFFEIDPEPDAEVPDGPTDQDSDEDPTTTTTPGNEVTTTTDPLDGSGDTTTTIAGSPTTSIGPGSGVTLPDGPGLGAELPRTGSNQMGLAIIAALLVLAGLAAQIARRRPGQY